MTRPRRSECRLSSVSRMISGTVAPCSRWRRSADSSRACETGPSDLRALAGLQRQPLVVDHDQRAVALRPPDAAPRNKAAPPECARDGCRARRRARSSSTAETRGCSRPCACARCRCATARAAAASDPSGDAHCETRTRAPWRATFPRRGARRRSRRRSDDDRAPGAAPVSSSRRCAVRSRARSDRCRARARPVDVHDQLEPELLHARGRETRSSRGISRSYRRAAAGTAASPDRTPCSARCSRTDESLPIE